MALQWLVLAPTE